MTPLKSDHLDRARRDIAEKVRGLRKARRWTQAELAGRLGLSQGRLSEIERGDGSFTAEQLLEMLRLFNVDVAHFAAPADPDTELQNALARLGALHLLESEEVLSSERFREVTDALRETLAAGRSPRLLTALAPVLVWNIDSVNLNKLNLQLTDIGLERRLGWMVENTLVAVRADTKPPRRWTRLYRRAQVVLDAFLELQVTETRVPAEHRRAIDVLDADIRSLRTLNEVSASASPISRRWGIATSLQPQDFLTALRAAHESG
jgi:HTH-type transcriptional regulator/antitoxin HipB